MVKLVNYKQYIQCKDTLLYFCKHFKKIPNDDIEFLENQYKTIINGDPQFNSYIYQFLFEAAYFRKTFSNENIMAAFQHRFQIEDVYHLNKNMSDISTVNSAFTIAVLTKHGHFKDFPITIYSTPLEYKTPLYYKIQDSASVKPMIELSKRTTGNTNCDVNIGGVLYDIKHHKYLSTNQNHIICLDYEDGQQKLPDYLRNLLFQLKSKASKDQLYKKYAKNLELIINEKKLTWSQKNDIWNRFIESEWHNTPPNIIRPMVFEITSRPYEPVFHKKGISARVHIETDFLEKPYVARRAIAGVTYLYGSPFTYNANIMTNGGIHSGLIEKEEIDTVD